MTSEDNRGRIEKARDKETQLASLYDEYFNKIAHYAYARIGNRAEAEDITSEVFLKALEALKTYQERGVPMQAWLFKIAHNLVVDHLRKATKHRTVSIDTVEVRDEANPEAIAEMNIELERVTIAMQGLTEEQREVVSLRFFGGLRSWEVATLLNKSDGAVRQMQRAALEKLRQLLDEGKPLG